jgi:hypothetical protein
VPAMMSGRNIAQRRVVRCVDGDATACPLAWML